METTGIAAALASAEPLAAARPAGDAARLPWHFKAVVFAATCILVGIVWDISWHGTIGRDTF